MILILCKIPIQQIIGFMRSSPCHNQHESTTIETASAFARTSQIYFLLWWNLRWGEWSYGEVCAIGKWAITEPNGIEKKKPSESINIMHHKSSDNLPQNSVPSTVPLIHIWLQAVKMHSSKNTNSSISVLPTTQFSSMTSSHMNDFIDDHIHGNQTLWVWSIPFPVSRWDKYMGEKISFSMESYILTLQIAWMVKENSIQQLYFCPQTYPSPKSSN